MKLSIIVSQWVGQVVCIFMCCCVLACSNRETIIVPPTSEITEVAVLMPFTGSNATLGRQYDAMIKLGFRNGLGSGANVNITSYSATNDVQVLAAMDKIIARGTKIILGPLYSNLTRLIVDKARANNIVVITMSNDPSLANSQLFVFGHAPLKQLKYIIEYFIHKDVKYFMALLPEGQHSHNIHDIIQTLVVQENATLMHTEFYNDTPESIDKAVSAIAVSIDTVNEMEDVITKPVVYITDDQQHNLHLIFNSIRKYNLDKKATIVGDNRINIDYPEHINITFTGSLNIFNTSLKSSAQELGINYITYMHALAYDLGHMTASYINDDFKVNKFINKINNNLEYIGISGNIYFIDNIAQRKYDIINLKEGTYSTVLKHQQ